MSKLITALRSTVNTVRDRVAYAVSSKDFSIYRPPSYYGYADKRRGLLDTQGDINEMIKAFRSLVYACIDVKSKEVANAGRMGKFKVYQEISDDEYRRIPNTHPLVQLLRNPNPWMSRWMLWYLTNAYLEATGNAYWWLAKDRLRVPREAWLIPSDVVRIVPGDPEKGEDIIKGYNLVWDRGAEVFIPADDIVQFKLPSLKDPYYYGDSRIMKAAVEVDIDDFISLHQRDFFKNDAVPATVVIFPTILKEKTRKELERRWIDKFQGKPGKTGFLEGGATIETLVNQKELDYLQSRNVNTKRIQAVFGVPDSKLMITETITARATLETIEYNFMKESIEPQLTLMDEQMTMDLARVFFGKNIVVRHDSTIPKDLAAQADLDTKYFGIGVRTINEIRKREGDEPIDGGDTHYIPFNAVPLDSSGGNKNAAGQTGGQGDQNQGGKSEGGLLLTYDQARRWKHLDDEETRGVYWRAFEAERARHERRYVRKLKELFNQIRTDVLSRGNPKEMKDDSADFSFDLNKFFELLSKIVSDEALAVIRAGFERFVQQYGLEGLVFSPNETSVRDGIRRLSVKTRSILETLRNDLASTVDEGVRLGETSEQLADRVSRFFDNTIDHRSIRIARTNSTFALNKGQNTAAINSGVFNVKFWVTQRDARVRDIHAPMDMVEADIQEDFILPNGDSLEIPGDPDGRAESVINCRCTAFYKKK